MTEIQKQIEEIRQFSPSVADYLQIGYEAEQRVRGMRTWAASRRLVEFTKEASVSYSLLVKMRRVLRVIPLGELLGVAKECHEQGFEFARDHANTLASLKDQEERIVWEKKLIHNRWTTREFNDALRAERGCRKRGGRPPAKSPNVKLALRRLQKLTTPLLKYLREIQHAAYLHHDPHASLDYCVDSLAHLDANKVIKALVKLRERIAETGVDVPRARPRPAA